MVIILPLFDLLLALVRNRFNLHDRHLVVELHWFRLGYAVLVSIPSSPFKVEPLNVSSLFRRDRDSCVHLLEGKLPSELIDRDSKLPRSLLLESCSETCGEREAGNPENVWLSFVCPVFKLIHSFV